MLFLNGSLAFQIGLLIALIAGITFHEFSHALVADQLGDHRPRALGRVSLNPIRHFEPIGALLFLIAGFGWGKPVPVNPYALRSPRAAMTSVALAGPMANFLLAIAIAILFRILQLAGLLDSGFAREVLANIIFFNIALGMFNLIPIPPLDGYNVVLPLLPPRQQFAIRRYANYGVILLLILLAVSYTSSFNPLGWLFDIASDLARLLLGA